MKENVIICFHQISSLRDRCEDFMMSALCLENCLEVYSFADFQNLHRLKQHAESFFLIHFQKLIDFDEFLQIGSENLCRVISSDELNVSSEEVVYEAVLRWIKHDLSSRKDELSTLLFSLRLPLMDIDYIEDLILLEPLIQENQLCVELVEEVINSEKCLESSHTQFNLTPRLGMYYKKMLVFSGGSHEPTQKSFCCFDVEAKQNYVAIKHHPTFDFKNRIDLYKLILTETNDIYFLGGVSFDDYHYASAGAPAKSSVLIFNQSLQTWEERTPMIEPKCAFGACSYSNHLYVFGGYPKYPDHPPNKSVFAYDIDSDEWNEREDVPMSIAHQAVTVFQNKAFMFGGNDVNNDCLNTVFQYTFNCDQWTLLETRIPKEVAEASAITHQNKIYLLGGCNSVGNFLSVLIYEPEKNKWRYAQDFLDDRKFTSITKGNNCIYVCGGTKQYLTRSRQSRTKEIYDLFRYDIHTNQWSNRIRTLEHGSNYTCVFANVNTKYLKSSPNHV